MGITLGLFCVGIVAASLLGGLVPLIVVLTHTRLQMYLSFAAGSMLGAAFFHMLPEAVELGSAETLRWAAAGLLALFFLERFFSYHHHESPDVVEPGDAACHLGHEHHDHGPGDHSSSGQEPAGGHSSLHWGAAAFGLALHSLAGGVALASAAAASRTGLGAASWGVFLATVIHKPADAITIVSLMLRAGVPRPLAHLVNLGFALMIPTGVILFNLSQRWLGAGAAEPYTAATLAFSAGSFLCIALSDLLPELQFHRHDRTKLSLALLAGFGVMALAGLWEV